MFQKLRKSKNVVVTPDFSKIPVSSPPKMLEQVYVSKTYLYKAITGGVYYNVAHKSLDDAVPQHSNEEVEVGVYQLVRVVKLKRDSILTEIQ